MKLPVILRINKSEFQMTLALNSSRLYFALSVYYINLTSHGSGDLRNKFQKSIYILLSFINSCISCNSCFYKFEQVFV